MARKAYKKIWIVDKESDCFYCGDVANTKDHLVSYADIQALPYACQIEWLVPACWECNNLLGRFDSSAVINRKEHLIQKLKKRYEAELNTADWTVAEIVDWGDTSIRAIITTVRVKLAVQKRLEFLEETRLDPSPADEALEWLIKGETFEGSDGPPEGFLGDPGD